jgi:beta-galactosidase
MANAQRLFGNGIIHGGDYNPDQWRHDSRVLEEDIRLMQKCGCNTFSTAIFAWSALEPEENRYDFQWLDTAIERLHAADRRVILATPSGARPLWMAERYPEVRRVHRDGRRWVMGERHNHCWTSPVYRDKVRQMNTELARRYAQHPAVVAWHVSNEYNGECYCDLCLLAFREWLRQRYKTLDELNRAWWSAFWNQTYSNWSQIDPRAYGLDGMLLDWYRFSSGQVVDFFQWEAGPLRKASPDLPITTNLMGFHFGVDYHALARFVDVVSNDSYPGYHADDPDLASAAAAQSMQFDMMRCLKGRPMPWFLMESCIDGRSLWLNTHLKAPGLHELEMLQAIAHGSNGTLYFQWRQNRGGVEKYHGAVVHHAHPEETRSFREVTALSARYAKIAEITDSLNHSDVAILLDWESRWAYRAALGMPNYEHDWALSSEATAHYIPFWSRGIGVDVLSSDVDFSGYSLVIAPKLFMLKPGLSARLRRYVEAGGKLVFTHLGGLVNETGLCFTDGAPGNGLEELCGVFVDETDELKDANESVGVSAVTGNSLGIDGEWRTRRVYSLGLLKGATPLAEYTESWSRGRPALTERRTGKGVTYFFLADFDSAGYERIYASIIRSHRLAGACGTSDPLPPGVTAQFRQSGATKYLFLLNFGTTPVEVPLQGVWQDVESERQVGEIAPLAALGARVLVNR